MVSSGPKRGGVGGPTRQITLTRKSQLRLKSEMTTQRLLLDAGVLPPRAPRCTPAVHNRVHSRPHFPTELQVTTYCLIRLDQRCSPQRFAATWCSDLDSYKEATGSRALAPV